MKTRRCVRVCLLLTVCLSTLACAGMFRNYGRFNPSDAVTQAFATFQVNKDFRYYITGPDSTPTPSWGCTDPTGSTQAPSGGRCR